MQISTETEKQVYLACEIFAVKQQLDESSDAEKATLILKLAHTRPRLLYLTMQSKKLITKGMLKALRRQKERERKRCERLERLLDRGLLERATGQGATDADAAGGADETLAIQDGPVEAEDEAVE